MNAASLGLLNTIFQLLWLLAALVALVFFVRIYARTRLSGFLWLIVAIIIGPLIARLSAFALPILFAASHGSGMDFARLNIMVLGMAGLLDAVLLIVAAVVLDRQVSQASFRAPEMPAFMTPPPAAPTYPYNR